MEGVAVACGIPNVTISPAVRIPFRVLLFPGAHSVLIPFLGTRRVDLQAAFRWYTRFAQVI